MTITTIDRDALRRINAEILAALGPIATRHGLVFSQGKSHFGGPTGDVLIKFACLDTTTGGAAMSRVCEDMMRLENLTTDTCYWPSVGYQRGVPGRWKIVDYKAANYKNPWILERENDSKRYKVPSSTVKAIFAKPNRIPASPPVIPVNTRPTFSQAELDHVLSEQLRQEQQAKVDALAAAKTPRFDTSHLYENSDF